MNKQVAKKLGLNPYNRKAFMQARWEHLVAQGPACSEESRDAIIRMTQDDEILGDIETGHTEPLPDYCNDWAAAGPIIEQEKIELRYSPSLGAWEACCVEGMAQLVAYDTSPTQAAMKAFLKESK
jgi:hypothetical protein